MMVTELKIEKQKIIENFDQMKKNSHKIVKKSIMEKNREKKKQVKREEAYHQFFVLILNIKTESIIRGKKGIPRSDISFHS